MGLSPVSLVSVGEAAEMLSDDSAKGPLFADTRPHHAYHRAHLPGAIPLIWTDFLNPATGEPIPPQLIAERLGRMGISRETRLILYDIGIGEQVGKSLSLLDAVGHRAIAILNGGIGKWHAENLPLTTDIPDLPPTHYEPSDDPRDPFATKSWIRAHLNDPDALLLDTRSREEFAGIEKGAARGGHIPGAVSLEWSETLEMDERQTPSYLPVERLRNLFASKGVTPDKEIVCYCQVGTRSAQVYGVLRTLGYPRVRNYLRSWHEWGNDPAMPVEVGSGEGWKPRK